MTVAVTGASGHIGANLVRALIGKGRPTRCLVHVSCRALDGLDVDRVNGDIRDIDSLCRAFRGVDVVYHLAASISLSMADWVRLEEINVVGTRNVVEACLRTGVRRLVHFSSIHAFQREPLDRPVDESNPLVNSPEYPPYDRSKAAGSREVYQGIERGLDAIIIHPTAVIGPHDYQPSFLGEAILMMAKGKLPALVPGGYDWVDVRDVVAGALLAEEKAPTGGRYLLSGHWVSMCDMAATIADIIGVSGNKFVCPLWLAHTGAVYFTLTSKMTGKRPLYTRMSLKALQDNKNISHEKASRELGYNPRPFQETLKDTLRWFKENGQMDCRIE
jgi:dihydroflavonol-4-reductase